MEGEEKMKVRDTEGERHFHYHTQHTLDILLACKHIRLAVRCIILGSRHSLPPTYFHGSCVLELHVKLLLPFISHRHMWPCCPQGMPWTHLGAIHTDVRPLFITSLKSCFWKINIVMYTWARVCMGLGLAEQGTALTLWTKQLASRRSFALRRFPKAPSACLLSGTPVLKWASRMAMHGFHRRPGLGIGPPQRPGFVMAQDPMPFTQRSSRVPPSDLHTPAHACPGQHCPARHSFMYHEPITHVPNTPFYEWLHKPENYRRQDIGCEGRNGRTDASQRSNCERICRN
jgi:hypothetical protein